MVYTLNSPIDAVQGIGYVSAEKLRTAGIHTIQDLLLLVPLTYEDRSKQSLLHNAVPGEIYTFYATVTASSQYYKGKKSIQRATFQDKSGKRAAMWFNNAFITQKLQKGSSYLVSGKINEKGILVQPTVEDLKIDQESIHTNRIIPFYSTKIGIKIGTLRRIFTHILENIETKDWLQSAEVLPILETFQSLHFPKNEESVIAAKNRLAIEELISLIDHSKKLKKKWKKVHTAVNITLSDDSHNLKNSANQHTLIPHSIPFTFTGAQCTATHEIVTDLTKKQPMNRLLVGDVGSGKTAVAGTAAWHMIQAGHSVAFIAPTQILVQQHANTLKTLFPDIRVQEITAKTNTQSNKKTQVSSNKQATLFVGTHALINQFSAINPALLIFDEQHRFGVGHRSMNQSNLKYTPHILTMTATPIPRSYMLTIFDHLSLSSLNEMPKGRKTTKTWLIPESKRTDAYNWALTHIQKNNSQIIHVCPFIEHSSEPAFEHIAAATQTYHDVRTLLANKPTIKFGLLHGKQKSSEKNKVTESVYSKKIQWLVTTPVVEVGLDLPKADIIIIEGAERFGLASLHQLRGRVGRAGQQGYCLLFTSKPNQQKSERLTYFCSETNGFQLAEYDLQSRGGGNIFGTQQHGAHNLQFADWANGALITTARKIYDNLEKDKKEITPFVTVPEFSKEITMVQAN